MLINEHPKDDDGNVHLISKDQVQVLSVQSKDSNGCLIMNCVGMRENYIMDYEQVKEQRCTACMLLLHVR